MIFFYADKGSVYANFRQQKDGKKVSLKYFPKLSDEKWNKDKQRFKDDDLESKRVTIEKAILDVLKVQDPFTLNNKTFASLINDRISGKSTQQTSFFDYCTTYYAATLLRYEKISARSIQNTIDKLKDFNPKLSFEKIDKVFYREFIIYLQAKDMMLNYTGLHIKNLKRILNHATDTGINTNLTFREFKVPKENVFNIYLNEKEIESIYNLEINELAVLQLQKENSIISKMTIARQIESLDRARKLFVIGCCTGLRVENYLAIDPHIQIDLKGGYLHAIMNKGGAKIKLPLHKYIREIVESGGFPAPVSQQKLNDAIKLLGILAGIKEQVMFTRTIGNRIVEYAKPKHELITSHTARRSFCSNLYASGVPTQYIMAISGHKSESTFKKYIQQVQKDTLTSKLKDYNVWG